MKTMNLSQRLGHYALSGFVLGTLASSKAWELTGLARLNYNINKKLANFLFPNQPLPNLETVLEETYRKLSMLEGIGHSLIDGDWEAADAGVRSMNSSKTRLDAWRLEMEKTIETVLVFIDRDLKKSFDGAQNQVLGYRAPPSEETTAFSKSN